MLSNHVLLQKAQKQRIDLETELATVKRQYEQLEMLEAMKKVKNFGEFYRQRRELFYEGQMLERKIHRARVDEEILRDRIKEEQAGYKVAVA